MREDQIPGTSAIACHFNKEWHAKNPGDEKLPRYDSGQIVKIIQQLSRSLCEVG
jgi:hypothetical protein